MIYQHINTKNNDGIITITIDREIALNSLNIQTFAELNFFFSEDYKTFLNLKGVIITGAGSKAFVAGADISEFLGLEGKGETLSRKGQDVFFLIEAFHLPVVAAINGFALGGGCELAMACHIRIASPNARFGQPEVNLGIIPGYGGTQRLIQYLGKGRAMELLMTADMIDAEKALNWGLITHIYEQDQLMIEATKLVEKIASKGPCAVKKIVECVNAFFEPNVDGFHKEVMDFGRVSNTNDFKEGASAFLEKRKANFSGN